MAEMRNTSLGNIDPSMFGVNDFTQKEVKYTEDLQGDTRSPLRRRLDRDKAALAVSQRPELNPYVTGDYGTYKSSTNYGAGSGIEPNKGTPPVDGFTGATERNSKAEFERAQRKAALLEEETTTEPTVAHNQIVKPTEDPTKPQQSKVEVAEEKQAAQKELQETAREYELDQVGSSSRGFETDWEKDNHFPEAAFRFFLNILDGNGIGESYFNASQFYDNRIATDRRNAYRDELLEDGYSPESIEKWISTGNQDDLFDLDARDVKRQRNQLSVLQDKATLESTILGNRKSQNELDNYDSDYEKQLRELNIKEKLARIGASEATAAAAQAKMVKDMQPEIPYSDMSESQAQAYNAMQNMIAGNSAFNEKFDMGKFAADGVDAYPGATFLGETTGRLMDNSGVNGWSDAAIRSLPSETLQALRLERDYLAGIMRKESGAAVSASEWQTRGSTFFPRKGDTPSDVARKSLMRELATMNMQSQTGYSRWNGDKLGELQGIVGNVVGFNANTGKYIFSDGSAATLEEIQSHARIR